MRSMKPILLVEDDRVDAMTLKRALKDLNVLNPLIHTLDGEEALDYLRDENNQRPCIILLDLNMPKVSGIEFLKIARAENIIKKTPVVVLTTSKDEQDIVETFELNVAGYMVKAVDYIKFVETIKAVNLY